MTDLSASDREELELHRYRRNSGRSFTLDFPIKPQVRFGWSKPPHEHLTRVISAGNQRYAHVLQQFQRFQPNFAKIPLIEERPGAPYWVNDWIPAADGLSIYGNVALANPATYLEIGSGISTTFVRQAITDHDLQTEIISIDPAPRRQIDAICDKVIRSPLEDCNLSIFSSLQPGDIVFCDNSHRIFQNSDVTAFFLDIVPIMPSGVLIGIHDVFLPHDYPDAWLDRFYNEQYLLGCWLLAGNSLRIELPVYHCLVTPELRAASDPTLSELIARGANQGGGAFWMAKT